jgi:hypothetical protein
MTSRQRPLKVAARVSQCFSSQKHVKNEPDTMQCKFFSGFLQQRHRGPLRAFRADMQSQNHAIYIYIRWLLHGATFRLGYERSLLDRQFISALGDGWCQLDMLDALRALDSMNAIPATWHFRGE